MHIWLLTLQYSFRLIIVTGGAGYIGSHTVVQLCLNGYKPIIVDNFSNSSPEAIHRIELITKQKIPYYKTDLRDYNDLNEVFSKYQNVKAVIHFAGLKAVGESSVIPLSYYDNNVNGTIQLLKVMKAHNINEIVFSSSATVYGDATRFENMIPIPEFCPTGPTNPYGRTKLTIEEIIHDFYLSNKSKFKAAILRYFNPIGAHPSGLMGEDPLGIPNNLLPFLSQVAIGRRDKLQVFGDDYNSSDGTPIRDYIHVVDLADGHISALVKLSQTPNGLYREWNLGTGKGSTVFQVINSFNKAVGKELPYVVVGRRAGDVLDLTANPRRANEELKWKTHRSIDEACNDLWNWTIKNPYGYQKPTNLTVSNFGDGNNSTKLYTLTSDNGKVRAKFINHGATIVKFEIKINDKWIDVVNGHRSLDGYKAKSNPYFGATIGPYANRIPFGKFNINGKDYEVKLNEEATNSVLHGGSNGFNTIDFDGPFAVFKDNLMKYKFQLLNYNDENGSGFPGSLDVNVYYWLDDNDHNGSALNIEYEVKNNNSLPASISMTNHSYFNLGRIDNKKNISGTSIKLHSNKYMDVDSNLHPNGKFKTIAETNFELGETDPQFDNCFVLDVSHALDSRSKKLITFAEASYKQLTLKASSTQPAFQFYTGDYVDTGNHGSRAGFCLESGSIIDAINSEDETIKKSVILGKNEVYGSRTRYELSLD